MNLAFTEVVPRTVFSFNFLGMLANGPPLFGSGVLESIFSSVRKGSKAAVPVQRYYFTGAPL